MLAEPKLKQLADLVNNAGKEELIWINGYISGLIKAEQPATAVSAAAPAKKITIVYGTETGNSKKLATELAAKAKKNHLIVKLAGLDQYRITDLTKEENLFVIISTQGDGEPPAAAQKFYDHIHKNGFRVDKMKYSVLALGDTSYPFFCKTGEDVDAQLHKLGGTRIVPIQKCDVDYDTDAQAWFDQVLQSVNELYPAEPVIARELPQAGIKSNVKKIYQATVLSNTNLNDRGADKQIHHIELAANEVDYVPGDSVGIVPENPGALVDAVIARLGLAAEHSVVFKEVTYSLQELLQKKLSLIYLHERVVKKYAAIVQKEIPEVKTDLLDLLETYPVSNATQAEAVLDILPAQSPRIYTIASSPSAHSGEIHLTVEKYRFEVNGEQKTGLCSDYLSQINRETSIEFFVQKNKRYRLPADGKDVIMIAPGTGIASARSFLSERDATGAGGKNWLFFGEEKFVSDFLYQTEIQNWFQTGVLSNISLAFSKDRSAGITVAHKIVEQGKEVYEWIESGAYVYLCGEKTPMGVEAEKALLQVLETYSGLGAAGTAAYFEQLKEEGRYAKDLY